MASPGYGWTHRSDDTYGYLVAAGLGGGAAERVGAPSHAGKPKVGRTTPPPPPSERTAAAGGATSDERWYEQKDGKTGETYYYNSKTGESRWSLPDWVEEKDDVSGVPYYVRINVDGVTPLHSTWTRPEDFVPLTRLDGNAAEAGGGSGGKSSARYEGDMPGVKVNVGGVGAPGGGDRRRRRPRRSASEENSAGGSPARPGSADTAASEASRPSWERPARRHSKVSYE